MVMSTGARFLTGAFCIVSGVGVTSAGFMHVGDIMDSPYTQHQDSGRVKATLTKPSLETSKVKACEERIATGAGCDAESIKLMMVKKDNEYTVSDIFTRVAPIGIALTLVGMGLWSSKKTEAAQPDKPDVPPNPGLTM